MATPSTTSSLVCTLQFVLCNTYIEDPQTVPCEYQQIEARGTDHTQAMTVSDNTQQ